MGELQLELGRTVAGIHAADGGDGARSGLPSFCRWPQPIATAARIVSRAPGPAFLLVGPNALLFANSAGHVALGQFLDGAANGQAIFDVAPQMADAFAAVLKQAFRGEGSRLRNLEVRSQRFNFEFTPVIDAAGFTLAVMCMACDVTQHEEKAGELRADDAHPAFDRGCEEAGQWSFDIGAGAATLDGHAMRILGLEPAAPSQAIGLDRLQGAVHPEDRGAVMLALRNAVNDQTPYRSRFRVLLPDGSQRRTLAVASPVRDAEGRIQRFVGVIIADVFDVDPALAESRIRFDTLTESLPQIVWSSDAEGRHDYFSRRWTEFTGVEPHEIAEHTWKDLVHPDDWERACGAWDDACRSGQPYDVDYRFLHHSGAYRWLRVMALPVRDEGGIITRWCGTSTDVHEDHLVSEERQRLAYELERIANWDQLTGVLTRRAFFERSEKIIAHLASGLDRVSVLMVDVDHFKRINDGYGHPAGDAVLSLTAKRMASLVKDDDLLGRLGGEEFALVLPTTSPEAAMAVAERIRLAIEAEPIAIGGGEPIPVTLSIGVTSARPCAGDLERLLSIADKALYQAKSGGRNRTVLLDA